VIRAVYESGVSGRQPFATYSTLLACEHMLERAEPLTDDQWLTVCLLMQYGYKTRIA
jgi:hypothetical protein